MKQLDLYLRCIGLGAGILISLSIVKITPVLGIIFIVYSCKEIYKKHTTTTFNIFKIIECVMVTILFISLFTICFSNIDLFVSYILGIISIAYILIYNLFLY
jgi:hypothetical protein